MLTAKIHGNLLSPPAYVFTKEDFVQSRKEAGELADQIKACLKKKKYL